MWTQEREDDGEEPRTPAPYVDGAWGRTANPNTADGELQNIAAFGAGLVRLTGWRRLAAKTIVWLILLSIGLTIIYAVIDMVRM